MYWSGEDTLKHLGVSPEHTQIPGNFANYMLKVVLVLALQGLDFSELTADQKVRVLLLDSIGRGSKNVILVEGQTLDRKRCNEIRARLHDEKLGKRAARRNLDIARHQLGH
jgi:hypothetical protein